METESKILTKKEIELEGRSPKPTSVRIPPRVREEAQKLVEEGYFGNLSQLIVTSLRKKLKEYREMDMSVKESRKAKARLWENYLQKADGDPEKASKMMIKDAQKEYNERPDFWKDSEQIEEYK